MALAAPTRDRCGRRQLGVILATSSSISSSVPGTSVCAQTLRAFVMELEKGEDGKEKGHGTLFRAAKLGFDKEKKQIEIESLGYEPIRLTDITRVK